MLRWLWLIHSALLLLQRSSATARGVGSGMDKRKLRFVQIPQRSGPRGASYKVWPRGAGWQGLPRVLLELPGTHLRHPWVQEAPWAPRAPLWVEAGPRSVKSGCREPSEACLEPSEGCREETEGFYGGDLWGHLPSSSSLQERMRISRPFTSGLQEHAASISRPPTGGLQGPGH